MVAFLYDNVLTNETFTLRIWSLMHFFIKEYKIGTYTRTNLVNDTKSTLADHIAIREIYSDILYNS
jgi:hypothetical protein